MKYIELFYLMTTAGTVGYLLGAAVLIVRAWRYPADPGRFPRAFDVFRPGVFSAAGQLHRRRALRFVLWGGSVVVCCWVLALLT